MMVMILRASVEKAVTSGLIVWANTGVGSKKHKAVKITAYTIFLIIIFHILKVFNFSY
jgi:hypothetical protein